MNTPDGSPAKGTTAVKAEDASALVPPGSAPSHIVALGASAGGLEALERFFDHLPADTGLAFVVVQHLSPDHKSMMVELLSKHTSMPVLRVEEGMTVEPGRVYLLPPRKNMCIEHGRLRLVDKPQGTGINLPIDIFFRSLAEDQGERAVAIVLSGTGSDGMRGVRAVKESGGLVMVQDEQTARFDGMPRSAISTGVVDYVLPPDEMPDQLLKFVRYVASANSMRTTPTFTTDEDHLAAILGLVRRQTGVDFTHYKPSTIHRRLERRMNVNQAQNLEEYLRLVRHSPRELTILYKELLIGVTKFFRDTDAFGALEKHVVPRLVERAGADGQIRVWVSGCATGEEAYSLAILFAEHIERTQRMLDVKVFATDIDRDAIEFASTGLYPESVAADLSFERLQRFFTPKGEAWQVSRQLRQMVIFATHDVNRDPPFTKMDLISCRNLLIYLEPVLQRKVLTLFHFALKPEGFLFLGSSESIGDMADRLRTVDARNKLYQSTGGARSSISETLPIGPRDSRRVMERHGNSDESLAVERGWQLLVEEFAPVSLLVDEYGELVHVFGDATEYLRFGPGNASLNILKLLPRGLTPILGVALQKVLREQREIEYQNVRVKSIDGTDALTVQVRPLPDTRGSRRFLLVMFERPARPLADMRRPSEIVDVTAADEESFADLQRELQYTRENLQATIEELETSNEELQATNEELLASNEELQSTNEELQSVNEELYTVNTEYQAKIQELTDLNNDMDNLLRSTSIGTLFLDENLLIRKFTPAVTDLVNVMARDIGRPIEHISLNVDDPTLIDDVRRVLDKRHSVERLLPARDGRTFLLRILPYTTIENVGCGVVVTFVDVTATEQAKLRLQRIIDSLPQQVVVVGQNGRIHLVNRAWRRFVEQTSGFGASSPGDSYYATWRAVVPALADRVPEMQAGIEAVTAKRTPEWRTTFEVPVSTETIRYQVVATPIEGELDGAVVTHTEISRTVHAR